MRLRALPVTPSRWSDLERLFGARGACAGCWCMWPRLTAGAFQRGKGEPNRRALKRVVASDGRPGLIAYAGREPIAWVAVAPRTAYARLATSKVMAPVDDAPVWSVPCFFVAKAWRGRGVTEFLLNAAKAFAARRGARALEGYPIDAKGKRQADTFVWLGLASAFEAAGFTEVARRSPTRPVFRCELAPAKRAARATAKKAAKAPARQQRAAKARARG